MGGGVQCPICSGGPSTSIASCSCGHRPRCKNCRGYLTARDTGDICRRCMQDPYCMTCNRHLPQSLFDPRDDKKRCYTCISKAEAPLRVKQSCGQIVSEIPIAVNNDASFEDFFKRTRDEIASVVEDYRQSLRYLSQLKMYL
jgi:hypothetical protein